MSDTTPAPAAPAPAAPATDTGAPVPKPGPPPVYTPPTTAAEPATPAADPAPAGWDGKVESLDPAVQRMIADLRTEAGDERIAKKKLSELQALLSPEATDTPPDPAQLAAEIAAARDSERQARIELAIHRAASAPDLRADAAALLDSRTFLARVEALDPASDGFAAQVTEAIRSAIADNPRLAATRAVGASTVEHAGGTGEAADLNAQIAAAEKAGEHTKALRLKMQLQQA